MTLAGILKERRLKVGLSLRALGKDLKVSGNYVRRVELGKESPSSLRLVLWAELLELEPDKLCAMAGLIPPDVERKLRNGYTSGLWSAVRAYEKGRML
jgi:transcriptional regulator with XRE-family HTH domain